MEAPSSSNMDLIVRNSAISTEAQFYSLVNQEQVRTQLKELAKAYKGIDISVVASESLARVGKYFSIAYSGSCTHPCSSDILSSLSDYQLLVKDSVVALDSSIITCISALKKHQLAIRFVEKDNFEKAIERISECSTMATEMAATAKTLADRCGILYISAKSTLLKVNDNVNISAENKKKIEDQIKELGAQEKYLEGLTSSLTEQIKGKKAEEAEIAKRGDSARRQAFVLSLIATGLSPITTIGTAIIAPIGQAVAAGINKLSGVTSKDSTEQLEAIQKNLEAKSQEYAEVEGQLSKKLKRKEQATNEIKKEDTKEDEKKALETEIKQLELDIAELEPKRNAVLKLINEVKESLQKASLSFEARAVHLEEKEDKIKETRDALEKEQRERNASLQETMERLKYLATDGKAASEKAITSLQLAVKTIGAAQTVFIDIQHYWENVALQCRQLADIQEFRDLHYLELKDEFSTALIASKWKWCVIGYLSQMARDDLNKAKLAVNDVMSNLPSEKELDGLIAEMKTWDKGKIKEISHEEVQAIEASEDKKDKTQ
jgi:DNA repair exonuclease SbcCD ATPase subunit